jgi:hypothetical protein
MTPTVKAAKARTRRFGARKVFTPTVAIRTTTQMGAWLAERIVFNVRAGVYHA